MEVVQLLFPSFIVIPIVVHLNRSFFKEIAMLNNYVIQHKNNDKAMHNYCIMHILIFNNMAASLKKDIPINNEISHET